MKNRHPIVQILIRAAWIIFWVTVPLFILATMSGYTLSVDPVRMIVVSLIISFVVQVFKTPKQPKIKTYLDVVTELLQGDRAAAIRLFNYNKEKFGGKTDEWLWQKVIRDIERDRR